jgi:hypothetical protein
MATIPIPTIARRQLARPAANTPFEQPQRPSGLMDLAQGLGSVAEGQQRQDIYAQREADFRANEADKAEFEQQKSRNLDRVSQARLEWTTTLGQRKTEVPEGAPEFTPSVLKEFDASKTKMLEGVANEREKRMLGELLRPVREHVGTDASLFELKSREQFRMRVLGEGAEQDAKTVALDPTQFRDVLSQRVAAITSSNDLTAEAKQKLIEHAREHISLQAGLSIIDKPGGPEAFLARVGVAGGKSGKGGKLVAVADGAPGMADPIINSLSEPGLRQLIERATTLKVTRDTQAANDAERRARMAEMAAAKRDREAGHAVTLFGDFFKNGLSPDMTDPVNIKAANAIGAVPELNAWYRAQLAELPKRAAAAMQPIAVQRDQLNALQVRADTKGTSKALDEDITFRKQALSAAESSFAKDPLRALGDRFPQARAQALDTSTPEKLEASVTLRRPLMDMAQQFSGQQRVSPLFDHEAPQIKSAIEALPEKERSAYIARLARAAGTQGATAIADQLDKNDKVLGLAFKAGADATQAGQYRSEFILRGAKAMTDKAVLKDSTAVAGWTAQIAKEIDRLKLPNAVATADTKAAAGYIVADLAAQRGGSAGNSEIKRAVEIALGGSVMEQGDGHIVLPEGVTKNQFAQRLRSIKPEQMMAVKQGAQPRPLGAADEMVRAGGAYFPLQSFMKSLPGARLVTVGQGMYSVLIANDENDPGKYVTTMEGERIVLGLQ